MLFYGEMQRMITELAHDILSFFGFLILWITAKDVGLARVDCPPPIRLFCPI